MPAQRAQIEIGRRTIAAFTPLYVVAEIGLNHGGSVEKALALVDAAADAGAAAVKLQTIDAEALVADDAPAPAHVDVPSLREFFRKFELDEAAHVAVAARARSRGLAVLATPFSEASVEMLVRVGVDAFKIASGDITWPALIKRCARTRRPLVMSTGMSTLEEIGRALDWATSAGATDVALLHCVSSYPVPRGADNLRAINSLAVAFGTPVGLSDHAADTSAVPLAVALGASIYERHLVLDRGDDSIDEAVSSTPAGLAMVVRAAAHALTALGNGHKQCQPAERANVIPSRRGLYAARPLSAGDVITARDVTALRPAIGLPAEYLPELIGRRLTRVMASGAPFTISDLGNQGTVECVA